MLTILNPQLDQIVNPSSADSSRITYALKFLGLIFFLLFISVLFYVNLWAGAIALVVTALFSLRKAIVFFFYVLTMDFSFDDEITKELKEM